MGVRLHVWGDDVPPLEEVPPTLVDDVDDEAAAARPFDAAVTDQLASLAGVDIDPARLRRGVAAGLARPSDSELGDAAPARPRRGADFVADQLASLRLDDAASPENALADPEVSARQHREAVAPTPLPDERSDPAAYEYFVWELCAGTGISQRPRTD